MIAIQKIAGWESLVELGKHTGLSPALLSKLERDVMHPTLPTLLRIAMVFSVGLEYFFNPEPKPVLEIVRKKDRLRFPDSPDNRKVAYCLASWNCASEPTNTSCRKAIRSISIPLCRMATGDTGPSAQQRSW